MTFEKYYNEIYAVVLLKYFWKDYADDFYKAESPDWVSPSLGLGMEVSQALLQQDGEAKKFIDTYLGERRDRLPKSAWERYGDAMYFYNDRLWGLHIPDEKSRREGYVYRAVYRFQKKLEKLNRNYSDHAVNGLFLFLHTDHPDLQTAQEITAQMAALQQNCAETFRYVFMDCERVLYVADLHQDAVEAIDIPEDARVLMQRQTEHLRQGTEWPNGAIFAQKYAALFGENAKKS